MQKAIVAIAGPGGRLQTKRRQQAISTAIFKEMIQRAVTGTGPQHFTIAYVFEDNAKKVQSASLKSLKSLSAVFVRKASII